MLSIKFTLECGADVANKLSRVLKALEAEVSIVMRPCDFGMGVLQILIGVICVSEDVLEAGFFRTRRPRLQKNEKIVRLWDGREIVFEKCLLLDISVMHSSVLRMTDAELRDYVIESVVRTLLGVKKKYDDFDMLALLAKLKKMREESKKE